MTFIEATMRRAQELALNGAGAVSPNPLVGCVIVKGEVIIGEGWHQRYGAPHAEVNAVASVADKSALRGSTVVVNLEPCSHHGKTPPCADLLISHHVAKVVISNFDPNPLVSGKGVAKLKEAGIEVVAGVLEKEGRELNRRFFTAMEKKRPYVVLKWAQTSNGLIAGGQDEPRWISNAVSRQLVHKWRSEEDSILVGYQTALADNPELTVRKWSGRDPVRIVIDRDLTLPRTLHLFDGSRRTIVVNCKRSGTEGNLELVQVGKNEIAAGTLSCLHQKEIHSVLIEGGSATLKLFLDSGLWDEARVFEASMNFKSGVSAPIVNGKSISRFDVAGDMLHFYQNFTVSPAPVK
jgi:diaminohydroxyphosphoribosylaminopyrimidine deaminase/5-amino-6-(5-phosphoribosylamino)uracil reductase